MYKKNDLCYGQEIGSFKDGTHGDPGCISQACFLICFRCPINSCYSNANVLGLFQEYLSQRKQAQALRHEMFWYIGKLHMVQRENGVGFTE